MTGSLRRVLLAVAAASLVAGTSASVLAAPAGAQASLKVTTSALANGVYGVAYDQTLAATGGTAPYEWSISQGSLPDGLALDPGTGSISGTPTGVAPYSFTVTVTDSSNPEQSASAQLSITVDPSDTPLGVVPALPDGTLGAGYDQQVAVTGGTGTTPYLWALAGGGLPPGLTLNTTSGFVSGTPNHVGTYDFSVKVTDSSSPPLQVTQPLSITVDGPPFGAPAVTGISPTYGLAGTKVTITGEGFLPIVATGNYGLPTVRFDKTPATDVQCSSNTKCTAVAPSGSGAVYVTVTTHEAGNKTSQTGPADRFTYSSKSPASPHYTVYWDQNEEQDFLSVPSGQVGRLVAPYNPNGQMCIIPDGSGRFVTGYDPTLPNQDNPGSLLPIMQPPDGEAVWSRSGTFTGQTIYVPGPYKLPGQTVGGDIPPDDTGNFNNDGTYTGCAFDHSGNLLADDLGTAQGAFPPPTDGRVIEWFAPDYTNYCIIDGPTTGGVGPHHVDGSGGLAQPGDLAFDSHGDLLVPEADPNGGFNGEVLKIDASSFPSSAAECCPDGVLPASDLHTSVFVQGSASLMPFPQSIAYDPACDCWGVASTIGDPAIAWFNDKGQQVKKMGEVPGESITEVGSEPNGYNPFGLTFAPDGTAYFVDIHIVCSAPLVNCGPGNFEGRIMRVTFTDGKPDPPQAFAGGYDFPTSVTYCKTGQVAGVVCPSPPAGGAPGVLAQRPRSSRAS